ncbi:MAG: serine--tRNA ligase [Myxococcota bacterium]|nr:serine--tRNA ligase [Myxococcota bacterium]MEC8423355.1 serine--tRNA ligase [Myxococcota bacterium]
MLDRNLVARDPELVRENLRRRNASGALLASLDRFIRVLARRRELQGETDRIRAERNGMTKQIGPLMQAGRRDEAAPLRERVKALGSRLEGLEDERKALELEERETLMGLPNLLDERVPVGQDESDNMEIRSWGTPRTMDFEAQDHVTLGEALDMLDFERASKLSGARFPVAKGAIARLERALVSYFLDRATETGGYTELVVPYIVSRTTMTGTGQLPKFEEDLFKLTVELNGEDAFLIPTAEVPVTNLHAGEILEEATLPLRYTAFTPCFRAEAGSHGRDVRGLMRQHQFHKVELVQLATEHGGQTAHEELTRHAEDRLKELGLPFRTVLLCSGDTSASARITYDLEVWIPSQGKYREISSCSWFGDYQARRMGLRYRPESGGKPRIAHTVNGSGLAVGRTVIAIMENYQNADGSIDIPEVLQNYMGGLAQIPAPA